MNSTIIPVEGWHDATFLCMDYQANPDDCLVWWFDVRGARLSYHKVLFGPEHVYGLKALRGQAVRDKMLKAMGCATMVEAIGKTVRVEVFRHNKTAQIRQVCLPGDERPTQRELEARNAKNRR